MIGFEAESVLQDRSGSIRFLGTVRHQFSPRITTLVRPKDPDWCLP